MAAVTKPKSTPDQVENLLQLLASGAAPTPVPASGIPFPAGPVGMLSPSDFSSVGPVGPVGTLSLSDHVGVLFPTVPDGKPSPVEPDRNPPAGLVPTVRTEFPDWKDPVVTQLPVWNPGNMVDVDMTIDVRQAVPDVIDSHAVVAMVGFDTARMGADAPMDCDSDCAERDILNEFEIVDGMPVYYGGNLYNSDWEDH